MRSILYYLCLLLFTLVYFVPFSLLYFLTVLFDRERVLLHYASRFWSWGIYRICPWWHVRVEGKEKVGKIRTYVIVTNHQSMLDIPLMYVLPLTFKWVSKREVMRMPIFGWVLQMHGDIAIERGSSLSARQMMRQAKEILDRGKTSVIIFPEGTRSKDGRIGRFREGAFAMAKHAGVGILPVVHEGNGAVLQGWRLKMPHRFRVEVLDPIPAEEVASLSEREMAQRVHDRMLDRHRSMRPDLYEEEQNQKGKDKSSI